MKTCFGSGCNGRTSGTANGFNLALEAVQPINARSGHGTGLLLQFQKFFSR